jgi:hypothetical protein
MLDGKPMAVPSWTVTRRHVSLIFHNLRLASSLDPVPSQNFVSIDDVLQHFVQGVSCDAISQ